MAPSKLTNAIGAVKDKTSIGLAKVGSTASISDLEIAIVKATRHEEYPPEEKHIREILSLTCYSRAFVHACVATISRRLSKTRNWVVALKSLMLIQRLLTDGDVAYQEEIFFATRRGTRLLNMSDFRDRRSDFWDYSAFVRMYGLYLDELLEFRGQGKRGRRETWGKEEEEEAETPVRATPVREMSNNKVFSRVQSLLYVLERLLACRPRGSTKNNRVVLMALYPIVKESFQVYYDIAEILSILVDRFMGLEVADSVKVYEIFCRVSNQLDELDAFYSWCKHVGIARAAEYPEVEKVPRQKLDTMDDYIRGKSNKEQHRRDLQLEYKDHQPQKEEEEEKEEKKSEVVEEEEVLDMNAIKALPPPEGFPEEEEKEEVKEEKKERDQRDIQKESDLLNLGEDAETCQEHGDKLALALFDVGPERNSTTTPAWEAFKDGENWETELVQAASHLSNQKASLGGGFDMMVLDGMYQRGAITQAMISSGCVATGSASSVALGSAGRPAMLALPAPPAGDGNAAGAAAASTRTDPFAASLAVPPPSYVQMSEMEKKQKLLVEEQIMWQQYARDGMQGQLGLPKMMQPNPCAYNNMGAAYRH